ncbi:MAG: hypothetical protein ABI559_02255 [Chloroflexota bacterium]
MRRLLISMGFVLAALLVAACGGDDDNATKTAAPTSTQGSGASVTTNGGSSATATTAADETIAPTENSGGGETNNGLAACSLLTDARVAEVMGRDVMAGVETPDGSDCTWDGETDVGLSVVLDVKTGSHQDMQDYFDLPIGSVAPVDGIGDASHWTEGLKVLEVLKGNYEFTLQIIDILGSGDSDGLAEAKALATDVTAKLP